MSASRIWTMYPAEHPTVRDAVERLRDAVGEALEAKVASAIAVTPDSLLVRGIPVPATEPTVAQMAAALHALGILEIGFDPVMPADAPARLLAFIGRAPESFEAEGGLSEAWHRHGHPAIRLVAVDYRRVFEDHDAEKSAVRDDVWRAIVVALASGRRTLDEREQRRLLELAEDPGELGALAEGLVADKCTAAGSPMVATQAATVLASFRHLASMASVLAPDRAQAIVKNLAMALLHIDPHISMQMIVMEAQGEPGSAMLSGGLSEEAVAQLLATVLALEGQATPRVAQVFDLLMPDRTRRRDVVARARALAQAQHDGEGAFDALWNSIEELLLSYDDHAFVDSAYRSILDAASGIGGAGHGDQAAGPAAAEMVEWMATVTEGHLRELAITLLADLLRLERETDRAVVVLNQLADLADDLLVAGVYQDALHVLDAIHEGAGRDDLTTPAAQSLQRIGASDGVREVAAVLGELSLGEWDIVARCLGRIGPSCLDTLHALLLADDDTPAAERAGQVFVAVGEEAIPLLSTLLSDGSNAVRRRVALLLGRIASRSAVPALQPLLHSSDPRTVQAAVRALAYIDDPAAVRALHTALRSASATARQMMADALVAVADRRVVPMLVRLLDNSRPLGGDYQVALHVLDALARLRDGRAVRTIAVVLFVRTWFLRRCLSRRKLRTLKRAAARALVQIGDSGALQVLDRARRTGDRTVRRVVRDVSVGAEEGAA